MPRSREVKRKGILFLPILILLSAAACNRKHKGQNVCPIDGSAPEWTGRRNGNSCEYFHYNAIERQTHAWWAECKLSTPEEPKEN